VSHIARFWGTREYYLANPNHTSHECQPGIVAFGDFFRFDYLAFAYLQTAQDSKALSVLDELKRIEAIEPGNSFASAYAAAAIPARYVLERRDWTAAAKLELPLASFVGEFPMAVAHIQFARAVGAARLGDLDSAANAVARLAELRDKLKDSPFSWWTGQVEIQKLASEGWLAYAQGKASVAEKLLRRAAELEDSIGTHPVTPGQILPVHEQLGDLMLELGKPKTALVEYERSLVSFPRRFLSHEGAAKAAELAGDLKKSQLHYRALLTMAGDSKERSAVTTAARAALDRQ
jgi:tetratricopeptide (TPR) repeat protein